ncbi:MAG: NnrU family protein [Gammaproteobacteria bacterium]|nr:NnrU family protein [Gammaproteobacteria bacterium]
MNYLVAGMLLFVMCHGFTAMRSARQELINRIGEMPYRGMYSVISIFAIGLIIVGMRNVEPVYLWTPPGWAQQLTGLMMMLSFILVIANRAKTNIKRYSRHPMSWGIIAWAIGHLFSNGKLSSLILFGGMATYSLFAMWSADRRGKPPRPQPVPYSRDAVLVAIGVAVFAAVRMIHP